MRAADISASSIFTAGAMPAPSDSELVDERALSKLRWRCRRGLLENDLLIARFFARYERTLTVRQAGALSTLMELSDPDLLDLLLARKSLPEIDAALDCEALHEILNLLMNE